MIREILIKKGEVTMTSHIATGVVDHLTLTVSDVNRAFAFYSEVLGFQKMAEFGPRIITHNGSFLLALAPAEGDHGFDETRPGLDHLSMAVADRKELERAVGILDERGVPHGEIIDLADFKLSVMMLRDPDNIQIELTAPHG